MSYINTLTWLHRTFTTRQRTAELLRPELDEHVLSQHDYELATRFLPGPSMDWNLVYAAGTSGAVYGYGSYLSRPRWNTWRLRLGTVAAFLVGSTYGTFRHFLLHYRFANSLENPLGFITALNHVDERLGGSGQIGFAFKEILVKKPEISSDHALDHSGDTRDTSTVLEEGWVRGQDSVDDNKSNPEPAPFRTRWDEIRGANSRSTGQSSWDTIRQHHERTKLPASNSRNGDFPVSGLEERVAAQARFDALLEAERLRCQDQNDSE